MFSNATLFVNMGSRRSVSKFTQEPDVDRYRLCVAWYNNESTTIIMRYLYLLSFIKVRVTLWSISFSKIKILDKWYFLCFIQHSLILPLVVRWKKFFFWMAHWAIKTDGQSLIFRRKFRKWIKKVDLQLLIKRKDKSNQHSFEFSEKTIDCLAISGWAMKKVERLENKNYLSIERKIVKKKHLLKSRRYSDWLGIRF